VWHERGAGWRTGRRGMAYRMTHRGARAGDRWRRALPAMAVRQAMGGVRERNGGTAVDAMRRMGTSRRARGTADGDASSVSRCATLHERVRHDSPGEAHAAWGVAHRCVGGGTGDGQRRHFGGRRSAHPRATKTTRHAIRCASARRPMRHAGRGLVRGRTANAPRHARACATNGETVCQRAPRRVPRATTRGVRERDRARRVRPARVPAAAG